MAQQTINVGTAPNDGTGTPLRTAFQYTNSNFSELYTAVGPSGNNIVVPGSATITGDLTVDTSTLVVNSSQNRVGIGFSGNASSGRLQISQPLSSTIDGALRITDDATTSFVFNNVSSGVSGIWSSGAIAFGVGSGTFTEAMRLNSTGLGVGGSPSSRLDVANSGTPVVFSMTLTGAQRWQQIIDTSVGNWTLRDQTGSKDVLIATAGTGNIGIGVTPSAWGAGYKALQLGNGLSLMGSTINGTIAANAWFDGTDWKYISANSSAQYYCSYFGNGSHVWTTSTGVPSAGGTVSYNQAMTLDASGNLLVGKTAVGFGTVGVESSSSGLLVATRSASTDGASATMMVYSTGAAAYRFYVGMGGTVFATNTTISAISDARLKENVQDIDVGLGAILALKPRKFDWKEGKGKNIKGDRGFIAQEFEQVFPQLVDEWKDPAPEGEAPYKSVRQDLIPVLVKAIQELTARVQTLETR